MQWFSSGVPGASQMPVYSENTWLDLSDMLHLIFGASFLHHSEFLIRITHPPLSDLHLNIPV